MTHPSLPLMINITAGLFHRQYMTRKLHTDNVMILEIIPPPEGVVTV